MNILVVEDEYPAVERLRQLLAEHPACRVAAVVGSVEAAVEYLSGPQSIDLIFCDIQLSDGLSFDIFDKVTPACPLVFTTGYDQYALRAFGLFSLDYLLKPIKAAELQRALDKYRLWQGQAAPAQQTDLMDQMRQLRQVLMELPHTPAGKTLYQRSLLVESGESIHPISTADIAYCHIAHELVYLVRMDGRRFVVQKTLEEVAELLDPEEFFRLNRQYVAHAKAIQKLTGMLGGRLKAHLQPPTSDEVIVSRDKAQLLKQWLAYRST